MYLWRDIYSNRNVYAEDYIIVAENMNYLQQRLDKLHNAMRRMDLKIKVPKNRKKVINYCK